MNTDKLTVILLAVLSCVWIGDFINGLFQKRKVKADSQLSEANATNILIAGANSLVTPLTNRLKEAEDEATLLRRELQQIRTELQNTMVELQESRAELRKERAENRRVTTENRTLRAQLAGEGQ